MHMVVFILMLSVLQSCKRTLSFLFKEAILFIMFLAATKRLYEYSRNPL